MSRAQHILAVIVGLITGVLLIESYGAMVEAARAGGRAIPELWPLGTEALALAMEVSVLEAKRLHHTAVLRLSWLLLVASVALSTLLQVAVAPSTLVGYLTAIWSKVDRATEATNSSHDSRSTARWPRRLASSTETSMARARASVPSGHNSGMARPPARAASTMAP